MNRGRPLALTLALLLVTRGAFGQTASAPPRLPSAADLATARTALTEGQALREQGDLTTALGRLTTAYDLVQTPVTAFELGKTHMMVGHVLMARELFLKVVRMPLSMEESSRSASAREEAARLVKELDPRIPTLRLTLQLPKGASAVVRIDDETIATSGVSTPRAVEPGTHVVVAKAGDGPELRVTVDVEEGQTKEVPLAPQWIAPREKAPPPTGISRQIVILRQTNPLVYAGFGVGTLALVTSGALAYAATREIASIQNRCQGVYCPESTLADVQTANGLRVGAALFGGAALGCFVVGILGAAKPTREKISAGGHVHIEPTIDGVRGTF